MGGVSLLGNFGPGGKPCVVLLGIFNGKELNSKSTPALKAQIMLDGNSSLSEILKCFYNDMKLLSFKRKIMCCRLSARLLIHITVLVCSTESKIVCLFQSFCPTAFFQNAIFIVKISGDRPKTYLATGL